MKNPDCKTWLRQNGYADVADDIEKLECRWQNAGKKTRRNWWLICAGTPDGKPCSIGGVAFPVIAALRARQGFPRHADAIERTPGELAPAVAHIHRWTGHAPKAKRATSKIKAGKADTPAAQWERAALANAWKVPSRKDLRELGAMHGLRGKALEDLIDERFVRRGRASYLAVACLPKEEQKAHALTVACSREHGVDHDTAKGMVASGVVQAAPRAAAGEPKTVLVAGIDADQAKAAARVYEGLVIGGVDRGSLA